MPGVPEYSDLKPRQRRRLLLRVMARPLATVVLLVALYYVVPFDRRVDPGTGLGLVLAGLAFVALLTWQIRSIVDAPHPRLRAIQTMSITLPLFLLIFAATYYMVERNTPGSFTQSMTRTDSLYFTVTVFATVGFGDITPVTESARVLTMVQMMADLLLVGLIARLVVGAVERGLQRTGKAGEEGPSSGQPRR